jgi:hypothetical protein
VNLPQDKPEVGLDPNVQMVLGATLRGSYDDIVKSVPHRLLVLLQELRGKISSLRSRNSAGQNADIRDYFGSTSFGPDTLEVLESAFQEAWSTLKEIGNETITRKELARKTLALAGEGELHPSRLCSRTLVTLLANPLEVAEGAPAASVDQGNLSAGSETSSKSLMTPTLWRHE